MKNSNLDNSNKTELLTPNRRKKNMPKISEVIMFKKILFVLMLVSVFNTGLLLAQDKTLEQEANEFAVQGDTFFAEGGYSKAGKSYEDAVEKLYLATKQEDIPLDNQKVTSWLTNAYNSYAKGSDFNNAVRVLDKRKELDPSSYDLVKTQAIIYKKYLKDIPKAIEVLKVYDNTKQTYSNHKRIGSYYKALEDFENSLIWYQKAYEKKKDSKTIKNIAALHLKLGQKEEAVKAYEGFILTNPSEAVLAKTYTNMGALYEGLKNIKKANLYFEKSLALKYDSKINLKLMADYYENENFTKAEEKISQRLSNSSNDSDAIYYQAMIKFNKDDKVGAKIDFQKLLESKHQKSAKGFIKSIDSE
jgi:tetratricopeptide (TPR) repeat protein